MGQTAVVRGTIDYVNESGRGFISTSASEEDVMFLPDAVNGDVPDTGQQVEFAIIRTRDGPRARNLQRV